MGLKIPRPQGRAGSIPAPGTNLLAIPTVVDVGTTSDGALGLRLIPFEPGALPISRLVVVWHYEHVLRNTEMHVSQSVREIAAP